MNLKELATKLGLSPTTVSRALNGYPEVNEATRERVMAAAKRHNYRPNTRAIRLATGRAMAVGHVIPVATRHEIVNPVFADFIAGAGEAYSRHDYDMVLTVVPDAVEEDTRFILGYQVASMPAKPETMTKEMIRMRAITGWAKASRRAT